MKKILSLLLSVTLILSFAPRNTANAEEASQTKTLNAFTVNNMSLDNGEAEQQSIRSMVDNKVDLKVNYFDISNNMINLNLTLDNSEDLSFSGELKKTYASPDKIIVGNLAETSGKYDVLHFSINRGAQEFISVTGNKYDFDTLNVYLQEKGTRNFTFGEIKIEDPAKIDQLFSNVNNLNKFENKELLWYQNVVQPLSIDEKDTVPSTYSVRATVKEQRSQKQFILNYKWGGLQQADFVYVNHILTYPSTNSDRQVTATIQKYYSYAWDYTNNKKVSDGTAADIKKPTTMIGLTNGQIQDLSVSGIYNQGNAGIKASINYGYSLSTPIPGVGINFGFSGITKVTAYPVYVGNKPSVSAELASGYYLGDDGDHMYTSLNLNNYNKGSIYARFKYEISNGLASGSHDTQLSGNMP